jgi:hypothetical protein
MEKSINIIKFYKAIKHLPEDERKEKPGIWCIDLKKSIGWVGSSVILAPELTVERIGTEMLNLSTIMWFVRA